MPLARGNYPPADQFCSSLPDKTPRDACDPAPAAAFVTEPQAMSLRSWHMRDRILWHSALFAAVSCLLWHDAAHAQIVNGNQWPQPRLTALSPTGGKSGAAVEVTF